MSAESSSPSSTGGPHPAPEVPELEVAVLIQDARWRDDLPSAERCARTAVEAAWRDLPSAARPGAPAGAEVSVVLTDDATVRVLNRDYRDRDTPTNVLSFANLEDLNAPELPDDVPVLLGDIVLARETVLGEAAQQGKVPDHHLSHLCVHGLLHLLGYDHLADTDAAAMEDLERRILDRLGIADPYAIDDRAGGAA